jgi:amino acid permease
VLACVFVLVVLNSFAMLCSFRFFSICVFFSVFFLVFVSFIHLLFFPPQEISAWEHYDIIVAGSLMRYFAIARK